MELRVYINNELLNDIPNGLDSFAKEFVLDPDLFGIYAVSTFDLVFVGDGYCKLKELFESVETCSIDITIQQKCNKAWKNIFVGIIEVGSIKINESEVSATCEIQDNSPQVLISRNADVTIDMQTTKDIYGQTITTGTFDVTVIDGIGGIPYNANTIKWDEAMRVLLEGITGRGVSVTSSYLNSYSTEEEWTIAFSGTLADITDITLNFTNFQGNNVTVSTFIDVGNDAITELGIRCLNEIFIGTTLTDVENGIRGEMDFRFFNRIDFDNPIPTILYLYSKLPININSIIVNGSTPITATITKTQNYEDKGNYPVLTNYRGLMNVGSVALLQYSFKELMTELNKIYNVFFIATFNSGGDINFDLISYNELIAIAPNITFGNAENLNSEFSEEYIYNAIDSNDGNQETLLQSNRVFTSEFCGIGDSLDLKNDFIMGSIPIQTNLALPFDEDRIKEKYIIDSLGSASQILFQYTITGSLFVTTNFIVNQWSTNWHKIYRHLSKFKNNIVGVAGYYATSLNDYNVNITNNSLGGYIKAYTFNEVMTSDEFDSLSDNIIDKARFKKTNDTTYREGIITSVRYNYNSGEAEITILGR